MEALKAILDGVLGQFVCEDGGIFRGQCPQLPKYMARKCGVDWPGKTGNGNKLVDTVVALGGYYGESPKGYRICSCDVSGSNNGHTWVEIKINGQWVIYEQNVKREGTVSANFGCGTVYSVSTTTQAGSWRKNARYAGHPTIDAFIDAHPDPKPEPTPTPTPEPAKFKVGDTVIPTKWVDYNGTPLKQTRDYYFISEINGDRAVLRADNLNGPVYAAMNTANLKKTTATPAPAPQFKVGDIVVPTRLVSYNGTPLVRYDQDYTITELDGDRAVLSARGQVWAAMNTADIRKV